MALTLMIAAFPAYSTDDSALEKWNRMSEDQKEVLRSRYKIWKSLSDKEKTILKKRFRKFQTLPREKREKIKRIIRARSCRRAKILTVPEKTDSGKNT